MTNLTISLGKAGSIDVDVAKLRESAAVVEYIFNYGLKQMLNDVHASEKEPAAKLALSQKKLDSLMRGEVAQTRVGGGDPVASEMRRMAEGDLKAKLKALGKKWVDLSADQKNLVIGKQLAANDANYRKAAEAKLAIQPTKREEIDLSDLGL